MAEHVPTAAHHMVDPLPAVRDPARLSALRRLRLLDAQTEEPFERLARIAKSVIDAPVVLISLVDADRQRFAACVGLSEPWASRRETPLSYSFCQYAVATDRELVIKDARADPVLRNNVAVGELGVVAYAGAPIRDSDGHVLGTFCVLDDQPRAWREEDVALLRDLAGAVGDLLEPRLAELQRPERQAVIGEVVRAQEAERTRIAAEVHDDTVQTLVGLGLRLQVLAEQSDDRQATTLERLALAARDTAERLRTLLAGLRPTGLDRGALDAALREHADLLFGGEVELELDVAESIPPDIAVTLFRIAQEALANARHHAQAATVAVRVRAVDGGVELVVRDDGRGLATPDPQRGHHGLVTMRERAELAGGTFSLGACEGGGVAVRAWVPLPAPSADGSRAGPAAS